MENPPVSSATQPLVDLQLRSPGKAILRLVDTLRPALKEDAASIARKVFQAPSVLIQGIEPAKARRIQALLAEIGADTELVPEGAAEEEGEGTCETALIVRNLARIPEVLEKVALLLRVPLREAQKTVLQSPALILGNLSAASAEALQAVFADVEAELVVSDCRRAQCDLYHRAENEADRAELLADLKRCGVTPVPEARDSRQPLVAAGIPHARAREVWKQVKKADTRLTIVNRDFYLFDLRLVAVASDADAARLAGELRERFGIPESLFEKIRASSGLILAQDLPFAEAGEHLADLNKLGLEARAELVTLREHTALLDRPGDVENARKAIELIAGVSPARIERILAGLDPVISRSLTKLQTRWLQQAIRQGGGEIRIQAGRDGGGSRNA